MQPVRVPGRPRLPPGDRPLAVAEDAHRRRDIEPFRQGAQDLADARWRRLEPVERRAAARADLGAARLAAKVLDAVSRAVVAVADQGMDALVRDAVVRAGGRWTGIARGRAALRGAP